MTYEETIKISQEELNYYNELLQLDLEEDEPFYNEHDIERLGAKKDDYISIRTIEFSNGNYITIDLASGGSNYYDNVVLCDKDGNELLCSDCSYEISDFKLMYDGNVYSVIFEIV